MFDSRNPFFKQVHLLVKILPLVNRQKVFALKGGTAINLFIRNLPRLSVDIDLVYLPVNDREKALAEIQHCLKVLANDIADSGIASVTPHFSSGKIIVSNQDALVKIEVNQVLRGHLLPIKVKTICSAIQQQIGVAEIQLLDENEIFAGKLCAALDRQHPRDLFDVKYLLENEGISLKLMDAFIIYLLSSSRPVSELLNPKLKNIQDTFINHFDGMTVEASTYKELEEAREKMLKEIKANLTEEHKNFLLQFKKGEIIWANTAFPEAQYLPAIRYKSYNLSQMPITKRKKAIEKLEKVLWDNE